MLEKAAAIKRFECSSLGKEMKKQTSVAKNTMKNLSLIKRKKTKQKAKKLHQVKSNLQELFYFLQISQH